MNERSAACPGENESAYSLHYDDLRERALLPLLAGLVSLIRRYTEGES